MLTETKKVAIVTPVHNRRELTLQCLRSLARIDRTNLDLRIIVVDDGSTDGTADAVRANFPAVEIIQGDGNLWYSGGMNAGIEHALKQEVDYVWCVNDDSIFDEKCLIKLIECAEKNPRSVVGAILLLWDKPHQLFQTSPQWNAFGGGWRHWNQQTVWTIPEKPWEVELIVGNCVLFPAQAIREVGLMFTEKLPHYGDAEYTPRMRKKGWRLLIEPRARVFCSPNTPPPRLRKMNLRQKMDALFFNRMHAHNIIKRFYINYYGAPTKLQGVMAFCSFFALLPFGKNYENGVSGELKEPPLKETYAHAVINE